MPRKPRVPTIFCAWCGVDISPIDGKRKRKYCSDKCCKTANKKKAVRRHIECKKCGVVFRGIGTIKHCLTCRKSLKHMQKWGVLGTSEKVCVVCNESFVVNRHRGSITRKYCSDKCRTIASKYIKKVFEKRQCKVCKIKFLPPNTKSICCSKACQSIWHYKLEVLSRIKSGKKRKRYPMSELSYKKIKDHESHKRKNLTDGYIIDLLMYKRAPGQSNDFGKKLKVYKSRDKIPQKVIELKRQQITLKRQIIKGRALLNGTT